jgi:MFS transporter, ACS family, hexuronate transporter
MAFVVAGVAGLSWLLLWFPLFEQPEKVKGLSAEELAYINSDAPVVNSLGPSAVVQEARLTWLSVLRYRQAWSFIVCKFLTDPVWWFFLIWLPDFFKKTRGLDLKKSWVHLVAIYSIVTVLSIVGGWLAGYLVRRGYTPNRARKTAMALFAVCVLPVLAVTQLGDWGAVALIGLAGAAHQAWSANLFTTVSDMFPSRAVATVVGVGGMAGSFGGILFPIYSGKLLDHFEAAGNITAGYSLLFGFCGTAYLLAFAIGHWFAPRFEPVAVQ